MRCWVCLGWETGDESPSGLVRPRPCPEPRFPLCQAWGSHGRGGPSSSFSSLLPAQPSASPQMSFAQVAAGPPNWPWLEGSSLRSFPTPASLSAPGSGRGGLAGWPGHTPPSWQHSGALEGFGQPSLRQWVALGAGEGGAGPAGTQSHPRAWLSSQGSGAQSPYRRKTWGGWPAGLLLVCAPLCLAPRNFPLPRSAGVTSLRPPPTTPRVPSLPRPLRSTPDQLPLQTPLCSVF